METPLGASVAGSRSSAFFLRAQLSRTRVPRAKAPALVGLICFQLSFPIVFVKSPVLVGAMDVELTVRPPEPAAPLADVAPSSGPSVDTTAPKSPSEQPAARMSAEAEFRLPVVSPVLPQFAARAGPGDEAQGHLLKAPNACCTSALQHIKPWMVPSARSATAFFIILALCVGLPLGLSRMAADGEGSSQPPEPPPWSYSNPGAWAADYPLCGLPGVQSPIDLRNDSSLVSRGPVPGGLSHAGGQTVLAVLDAYAGHAGVRLVAPNGAPRTLARWVLAGRSYNLVSAHFHSPGEHAIGGVVAPLEAHFVHEAADGEGGEAILAVMYPPAAVDNVDLVGLWPFFARAAGAAAALPQPTTDGPPLVWVDLGTLLNDLQPWAITYSGSQTAPPCLPDVTWVVTRANAGASARQVTNFAAAVGAGGNARPLQDIGERAVSMWTWTPWSDPAHFRVPHVAVTDGLAALLTVDPFAAQSGTAGAAAAAAAAAAKATEATAAQRKGAAIEV